MKHFTPADLQEFIASTSVIINDESISHILRNFEEHREVYANHIRPTLENPAEIWLTKYRHSESGRIEFRKHYVMAWADGINTLAIVIQTGDGPALYDFIPLHGEEINEYRCGTLLYVRPEETNSDADATDSPTEETNTGDGYILSESCAFNKKDEQGRKQGYWVERLPEGDVAAVPHADGEEDEENQASSAHARILIQVPHEDDGDGKERPQGQFKRLMDMADRLMDGPHADGESSEVKSTLVYSKAHPHLGGEEYLWRGAAAGSYVDGHRQGHWDEKFPDGGSAHGEYVDGKRHGDWIEKSPDGEEAQGPYVDGKKHGQWIVRTVHDWENAYSYVDGKRHGFCVVHHGEWGTEGWRVGTGHYVNDKKHGEWTFNVAGGIENKGAFVDGKKHGQWVESFPDGREARRIYRNGKEAE